jgi:hypothetical protein
MEMSNAARHWLGALIGLALAPAIGAGLAYATWRTTSGAAQFGATSTEYRIGLASLAVIALVMAFAVASRMSPFASLLPGLALTALGGLWVAAPKFARDNTAGKLPDKLDDGYLLAAGTGLILMLGVLLLIASLFPSRWRARETEPAYDYSGQDAGYAQQPAESQTFEHTPQYGRTLDEGPPPFGGRAPDDQPGFGTTAPDWGARRDPGQP